MRDDIRVIVEKNEFGWVAQGIDIDVCAQAEKEEDLQDTFLFAVQLRSGDVGGMDKIPQAPKEFFDIWNGMNTNSEYTL